MKSLSIGSPFLNYMRSTNSSQSTAEESSLTMTPSVEHVMKEFAPRLFRDHMKQVLDSKVTVSIYHSVETSAGFLVKTTCSIWIGTKLCPKLIESSWTKDSRPSILENASIPLIKQTPAVRVFLVWTSPAILRRVQNPKQEPSSGGYLVDLYPE